MKTDSPHLALFLKISSWLTGFEEVELQGTGMVEPYYATLTQNNTPANLDFFFHDVRDIFATSGQDEQQILNLIATRLMPNSSYNNMAKQIILMWYTGQWFSDPTNGNSATQINAQSYVQALMWPAADTHPPGAKQPGYGSWANVPINASGSPVTGYVN